MIQKLHIVSLDIPFPPNYGGMIDVFYKIKALYEAGVEITLHCFQYGFREPSETLNQYCKKVYYYPRITGFRGLHYSLPYIISSRNSQVLLNNLLQDENPILFDGLHTTFWMQHPALKQRKKLFRAHNIESEYYRQLAQNTSSLIKKIYYFLEANRLLRYENSIAKLDSILAISEADKKFFIEKYPSISVTYVPAFHAYNKVTSKVGKGSYCLYHGNLSVAENIKSVQFLVNEVFNDLDIPLLIAGKDPTPQVKSFASDSIKIISNPTEVEMQNLIEQAHIHVLPSFQNTGMKLKLLHSLFAGRFIVINHAATDSIIKGGLEIAHDVGEFKSKILQLRQIAFSEEDFQNRKLMMSGYLNASGAQLILSQ